MIDGQAGTNKVRKARHIVELVYSDKLNRLAFDIKTTCHMDTLLQWEASWSMSAIFTTP